MEDQRNKIDDMEINPPGFSHLILSKEPKTHVGENSSTNGIRKTGFPFV
jgi:hypothetical protein